MSKRLKSPIMKIEITEEVIDWLEQHSYCLSREDCEEFAHEFFSFMIATGALIATIDDASEVNIKLS